jgi:ParB family chromosome partitioning protein
MLDKETKIEELNISELREFKDHPFKVDKTSQDFLTLKDSISKIGVANPIVVRYQHGGYEIISGHRRTEACRELGIKTIPAIVSNVSDMEAILAMVDSNIQRENILISERAFAYKMKLNALTWYVGCKDKTVSQFETPKRNDEVLAEQMGISRAHIQRYIRLTNLKKPLLDMVDNYKIPVNVAVELSFLQAHQQQAVFDFIEENGIRLNVVQAKNLREYAAKNGLGEGEVKRLLTGEVKSENPYRKEFIKKYFPKDYTDEKIATVLKDLLAKWKEQTI